MRIVARTADLSFPNERAACLACTLWVQAVVGALLPTTLLLAAARASAAPAPPAAELPASGTGGQQGRREGWLALLEREFQEHPAQMAAFTAQLLWLVLRTATAVLLE